MRLAAGLVIDLGVRPGDRVAIAMQEPARNGRSRSSRPRWSGAIAAPLNAFWNGAELAFGVEDCEPRVLIADGERFERLLGHESVLAGITVVGTRLDDRKTTEPLPEPIVQLGVAAAIDRPLDVAVTVDPDDATTMLYTSGTTSHPKGVLGTHRNICAAVFGVDFVTAREHGPVGCADPSAGTAARA